MARTKNFSPELILERLADVFTKNGYSGTSLSLLMSASGLSKQSLYDTYGNKQAMYLQAIDCVLQRYEAIMQRMQNADSGRQALQIFFDQLVKDCASGEASRSGCIVSGGLLESLDEEEIQAFLEKKWLSVNELLKQTIQRGQKDGSISSKQPAAQLADFFMALMSGLRVTGRAVADSKQLKHVLQTGFKVLG